MTILNNFIQENERRKWEIKSAVILRGDEIVESCYSQDANTLLRQYSITKAFTTSAIGILQDKAIINLDDPIVKYLREPYQDDKMQYVQVRHLLMNVMGIDRGYLFESDRHTHSTDNYLSLIMNRPLRYMPGERFTYSNSNYYLLSRIIENISGMVADDFINEHIFKPLDITHYDTTRCPYNHFLGGSGLFLRTQDVAKLAVVYANQGLYKGKRILSKDYVKECINPQFKINSKERYGYSFMMKDARCAFVTGKHNQLLLVDKNQGLSVVVNSHVNPSQSATLMKIVRRFIINSIS